MAAQIAHSRSRKAVVTAAEAALRLKKLVPSFSSSLHKGTMGRIGVVGGSTDYTGAPFYAAASSLRFGGDLAYVFCEKSAASAIKSYSPELMVTPFYSVDALRDQSRAVAVTLGADVSSPSSSCPHPPSLSAAVIGPLLPRLHALVVGPGLGRDALLFGDLEALLQAAIRAGTPLVIDADGLAMLEGSMQVIRGYPWCVLTPNMVEFDRLVAQALVKLGLPGADPRSLCAGRSAEHVALLRQELQSGELAERLRALCNALDHVTILVKGERDLVSRGGLVMEVTERGSPRRCGGQGDLLAGALGVAAHWAHTGALLLPASAGEDKGADVDMDAESPLMLACVLASLVVRRAAGLAFAAKHRSTTTPDILEYLGEAFESIVPCEG